MKKSDNVFNLEVTATNRTCAKGEAVGKQNMEEGNIKVVLIDGCFMGCHGRIIENLIGKENLIRFDALSIYNKYTDRFDIDSVTESERLETAREVADWFLSELKKERVIESKKDVNTSSCG